MKIRWAGICIWALSASTVFGQSVGKVVPGADTMRMEKRIVRPSPLRELRADLETLATAPEWNGAHVGVAVVSLETGEMLYRKNEDKYFIPASLQKLFTTATALSTLGVDFRYTTSLYLDGELQTNGEFNGNIIVRGSGDPTISQAFGVDPTAVMDRWALILDSLGIRSIKGSIIGDDDVFDDVEYAAGWSWDDLVYSYAPQVSGLNIADNSVRVSVLSPYATSDVPQIRLLPENDYVRIVNGLRVVDSTGSTSITPQRDFRSNVIDLTGTVVAATQDTARVSVSVDNPTLYALNLLRTSIQHRGIRFRGAVLDVDDWTDTVAYLRCTKIATHTSAPMSEIVNVINRYSNNLGAEALLKTIGATVGGEGSFSRGIEEVKMRLQREGISSQDITIVDGSGLSRFDLCTPRQISTLLGAMFRSPLAAAFRASLAEPGEPGTLQRRMRDTRAEHVVRAKTGTMNGVSTLAGYVTTRDGEPLAFAIMINNFLAPVSMAQNMQDMVCMRLASFSKK